jgi:hypothetical protein
VNEFSPLNLPSLAALLELACRRIPKESIREHVMIDPGTLGYIEATERVFEEGVRSVFDADGRPLELLTSFDLNESLVCFRMDAEGSPRHRWFGILGACLKLFQTPEFGVQDELLTLARCALALEDKDALALTYSVCVELTNVEPPSFTHQPEHQQALATLCQCLLSDKPQDIAAQCHALEAYDRLFQTQYEEDWSPCPLFAAHEAFILGAALDKRELKDWLALIEDFFPTEPAIARATRERLLVEGRAWQSQPRNRQRPPGLMPD